MHRARLAFLAVLLLAPARALAQDQATWDPKDTYAWVVSVCEWQDKSLATFKKGRRDDVFVEQLEKDGVPQEQLTYLKDSQATREAMLRELHATVARSGPGTTLIVYYQGHGMTVHGKGTYFANYDVDTNKIEDTAFPVDQLSDIVASEWKGSRLILIGDCCHSGSLEAIVHRFDGKDGVAAACLASATASNRSTGNWTFTEALIEALEGWGEVDEDQNGTITLAEVDEFTSIEMRYREGQLTHAVHTTSFQDSFAFRAVDTTHPVEHGQLGPWKVRDYCEAQDQKGNWYVSQVIGLRDGEYRVHFLEWDSKWDEWVKADRLRPVSTGSAKVGDRYLVQWEDKKWYPAIVVQTDADFFYFVHYEDEAGEDDEWVTKESLGKLLGHQTDGGATFAAGEGVAAEWHKAWFLATVTSQQGEIYSVRYADGDTGNLTAVELRKLVSPAQVKEGDRVIACWAGKPRMYPGSVTAKGDGSVTVKWDDGTKPSQVPLAQVASEN